MRWLIKAVVVAVALGVGQARKMDSLNTEKYQLTYYDDGDDSVSFYEAQLACTEHYGYCSRLVKINEEQTQDALELMLIYWSQPRVWIGATDMRSLGAWYWLDGTALRYGYTNWGKNQPDDDEGDERCATWGSADYDSAVGTWHDWECYKQFGYVCQTDRGSYRIIENKLNLIFPESDGLRTSFKEAQKHCENVGSKLVKIRNEQYAEVQSRLPRDDDAKFWIQDNSSESGCAVLTYNRWQYRDCDDGEFAVICEAGS